MIRAIIVDDELTAIKSLQWEITNFCEDIEIIDSFTNPVEAISAINYLEPDCVFLDIEMPEMDGFQLLDQLEHQRFDLIITTAYDSYALQAFKENAIDYLLKPVDTDDLLKAISKIKAHKTEDILGKELFQAIAKIQSKNSSKSITLSLTGKSIFVKADEIMYCKSEGNYTKIFFNNSTPEIVSKKIKDLELMIEDPVFFRIHNSYLVNLNHIKEYVRTEGYYVVLDDGTNLPVSRTKKKELFDKLNQI